MNWLYKAQQIEELPKDVVGFVYIIYYTDDTMYVGSKLARSERRKKPLKGMRVNAKRMVMTEHNWNDYIGSSKLVEDKTIQSKHILHLCTNKRSMTYLEVKELMSREVLETDTYMNNNINGNWFDNCMDGLYVGEVGKQKIMEFE